MVEIIPIITRKMLPPQDDFLPVLLEALPVLAEGDIVVVTSKVVAIEQGRCVSGDADMKALILAECEAWVPVEESGYGVTLTIKGHTLIANAGIDESNANGSYILWPENPHGWAEQACKALKVRFGLTHLAVIVTDSYCVPLRWGVTGIAIGFYGLEPVHDYRGSNDLFGRALRMTKGGIVDPIAAAAVGVMGEGDECQPAAVVRGWPRVQFVDYPTAEGFGISAEEDLYAPILKGFLRKKVED